MKTKTTKGGANKRPKKDEMLFTDSSCMAMEMDEIAEIYSQNLGYFPNYRDIQRNKKTLSHKKSRRKGGSEEGESDYDDYR